MDTWGSRAVTAVLGVAGGAVVLTLAWLLSEWFGWTGPGGLQLVLVLLCAPIVVCLVATRRAEG